jgi:hypothetical protein
MYLVMDPALAAVVECVREMHAPVDAATTVGRQVSPFDVAALSGAVGALLDAIDARPDPAPARALQAVA